MKVPDIAACAAIMEEQGMLANIREHSFVVARVAALLAEGLQQTSSQPPDLQLCISGALLHDIAKTPCLKSGRSHAKAGAELCRSLGFPEIAEIVAAHVILSDFNPARYQQGIFSAQEIVYYADKRVLHDKIVSLPERLAYIVDKYSGGDLRRQQGIQDNFSKCGELENCLFFFLNFPQDRLAEQTEQHKLVPPLRA